MTLYRSKHS